MTSLFLIAALLATTGILQASLLWLGNKFPTYTGGILLTLILGSPFSFMAHLSGVSIMAITAIYLMAIAATIYVVRRPVSS